MIKYTKTHKLVDQAKAGSEEALQQLYHQYYYIARNAYEKYDGEEYIKAKELSEKLLQAAIFSYCEKVVPETVYRIAEYIKNKFQNFDNRMGHSILVKDLEQRAHLGDQDAIKQLFERYTYIANDYAHEYYQEYINMVNCQCQNEDDFSYLDSDFKYADNFISEEDIRQDYILDLWQMIISFYSQKYSSKFVITFLYYKFELITVRKIKKLHDVYNKVDIKNSLESIKSYVIDDCLDELCIEDTLNLIENLLPPSTQRTFHYLKTHSVNYAEAGRMLGISRECVRQHVEKAKSKVKSYKII